jgi:hypothetical protein
VRAKDVSRKKDKLANSSLSKILFSGNDSLTRCFTNESIGGFEMDGEYHCFERAF